MIPMAGILALRTRPQGRVWWIPLPLFLLWLILLPALIVVVPAIFVVSLIARVDPFNALGISWQLLAGLRGLRVHVEDKEAAVLIRFI
jgi:hypothetical protein